MKKSITFSKDLKENNNPSIEFSDPKSEIQAILTRYDTQTNLIIGIFIVAFITMIIMVATLVIDSFHINSVTYKEYSQKIEEREQILEVNQSLINENRKMLQIIENQTQTINALRK